MEPQSKPVKAGQYYLLEKIAQGGMAEIFKGLAYDLAGIKKTVCIKKILPHIAASKEFIDMLVDEAKIAVKLNHGSIAQVYDLGKAGEDYFIVMEYVDGQSLSKIHKKIMRLQKRIPIPIVCTIVAEIASGLDYMHRKTDEGGHHLHIVHRDISPQNIVVSYSGTVKIIDFGIAKAAVKVGHTESGILKGKFAYMSPEQARGDKTDHRSDIFSLGVIFHELLTGQRLFKGKDNKETLKNVRKGKADPPSKIIPDIPSALDKIVLKSLKKNRRERYAFAAELQEELLRFLHGYYPDFKPSQVADYVKELFKEELYLSKSLETQEAKTPHLILEVTKETSDEEATAGGSSAIDWREFMLEAEWPGEDSRQPSVVSRQEEKEEISEPSEQTSKKWFAELSFKRQAVLISLALLFFAGISLFFFWEKVPSPWSIVHSPKQEPPIEETITPQPQTTPKPAGIHIESNPPGAVLYLNDTDTGFKTPADLENLPLDRLQTLGLYLEGYKFYKTDFTLKKGETKVFHVELAVNYGSLKIISTPSPANVWIEGELAGETPLVKESLEPGKIITLEVEGENFVPFRQEIKIEAGKEQVVNVILEHLPPLPKEMENDTMTEPE